MAMGVVLQMVQQNDDKAEAAHTRLRLDQREMEKRVMALERAYTDTVLDFTRTKAALEEKAKAPIDILRIGLSLKLALAIVGAVLAMAGTAWSSAAWVKSDVQSLRGDVKSDIQSLRSDLEGQKNLAKERHDSLVRAVDELRKRQELTEIEVRNGKRRN